MTTPISNHVEIALSRLIEQYKKKPNLQNLITALLGPIQGLEDTFQDLDSMRTLSGATGVQLDRLGVIVGIARAPGEDDTSYRVSISTKVSENISQGEPERVIATYRILLNADLVLLSECFPGGVGLMSEITLVSQDQVNDLIHRLKRIVPAGVRVEYLGSFDPSNAFAMDGALSGQGFGSVSDPSAGGGFGTISVDTSSKFAFGGDSPIDSGFGSIHDPLVGGCMVGL